MRQAERVKGREAWARMRLHAAVALIAVGAGSCAMPPAAAPTTTPTPAPPPATPTAAMSCAEQVFDRLTVPQRVGQLFALGLGDDRLGSAELGAIRRDHVGSMWFTATTTAGVRWVRSVADAVQSEATRAATGGVGFFVAANQEGGRIQALRGPGFSTIPSAVAQGTEATASLRREAAAWGAELRAAGVNLDFAPVMDVVPAGTGSQNAPIGALQREFGSDPAAVARHGAAFVRGMDAAGIVTTAKHFPGLGRVTANTDAAADVVDTVTTTDDPTLASFRGAIDAGVPMVMVALATYERIDPDHLAAFSPTVMRLLRGMGFDGVIASDSFTATAVAGIAPERRAIDFIAAGGDLIVARTVAPTVAMVRAVLARARSDRAFAGLVDAAARRILTLKRSVGLLPCPR